jgi:predicted TIM-barrel fold metal-dependent hydrolase
VDEGQAGRPRARPRAVELALALALVGCKGAPPREPSVAPAVPAAPAPWRPSSLPRIDVHTHLMPDAIGRAVALASAHGIVHLVNLSGGSPGRGLEEQMAAARAAGGRVSVFCNADFREAKKGPGYGARLAAQLERSHALGAIGLKIPKGLGLGYMGPDGKLLAVDDPGLDPLFEKAGELGMPVLIHTGDPKAFWLPATPQNERYDELVVHPGWGYYGEPVPSWQALFDAFERRVARHPRTIFIGAHFGNDPEDPDRVAALLDKYPNLYIDTAARVPEIGRQGARDPIHMRELLSRHADRVLFGTDSGVGADPSDLMLGSTGAEPPTPAEVERFFESTWRYFETDEHGIVSPTAIQGRWRVDGVALPREALEKIYAGNAERLLHITLK